MRLGLGSTNSADLYLLFHVLHLKQLVLNDEATSRSEPMTQATGEGAGLVAGPER